MITLESFYKTPEWEKLRAQLMMERTGDDGLLICERCGRPILKRYDCIAHHREELTEENVNDFTISLNPDNIELIHFKCHNKLHKRFDGFSQSVFIVYGSPCAGKSTWVEEVAEPDDLILDLDRIWEAIGLADRYHKNNRLRQNVFGIRDCIIDQIRIRKGMWRNAYIIGGYPLRSDRDRLCDMLGATPVYIEATRDECLARAETEEWKDYIEEWWATHTE